MDVRRNRQKNRQRADEISNRKKEFQKEDGKTDRVQIKFQKEDSSRKYFIQAADRCQKGQTEKQTEGR